jgi:hypothetical protein
MGTAVVAIAAADCIGVNTDRLAREFAVCPDAPG